jgi:hypothetical protein
MIYTGGTHGRHPHLREANLIPLPAHRRPRPKRSGHGLFLTDERPAVRVPVSRYEGLGELLPASGSNYEAMRLNARDG